MTATRTATTRRSPPSAPRRWASGRELDLIEQLAFAYRAQLPPGTFLQILPVAVDANVLLNTVARVASGKRSELLAAVRLGLIRVYVGESIPAEVEDYLAYRASVAHVPVAELERIWHEEVRPKLRVVETGSFEHPNLAEITVRDVADRPTAVLSLFIGARLTWSSDRDLTGGGYAERLNVEIVLAAETVGQFDLSAHLALRISEETIGAAGRSILRAIDRSGPERTVAIVVVAITLTALTVALIKDAERVKQTAARVAQVGIEAMQQLATHRVESGHKLPAVTISTTEQLPVRLARALAVAPAPLTIAELAAALGGTGASVEPAEIEATLRQYRAFVEGRSGFQLGKW